MLVEVFRHIAPFPAYFTDLATLSRELSGELDCCTALYGGKKTNKVFGHPNPSTLSLCERRRPPVADRDETKGTEL